MTNMIMWKNYLLENNNAVSVNLSLYNCGSGTAGMVTTLYKVGFTVRLMFTSGCTQLLESRGMDIPK